MMVAANDQRGLLPQTGIFQGFPQFSQHAILEREAVPVASNGAIGQSERSGPAVIGMGTVRYGKMQQDGSVARIHNKRLALRQHGLRNACLLLSWQGLSEWREQIRLKQAAGL